MLTQKIAIIGAGNMGGAIAQGLLNKKAVKPEQLILTNPKERKLASFKKQGCVITANNANAAAQADSIILAVKPQIIKTALQEIKPALNQKQLVISVAAGVEIKIIKGCLYRNQPVVRVMPNLCATAGASVSAWVKSKEVSSAQIQTAKAVFSAIGIEMELKKEVLVDAVTAISGCGPAYVFYLAELLEKGAERLGIPKKYARELARQTLIGSALFLKQSSKSPRQLRDAVTSKGGATEAAFKKFNQKHLQQAFLAGIVAAYRQSQKLGYNITYGTKSKVSEG